jgi:hypothetical protein
LRRVLAVYGPHDEFAEQLSCSLHQRELQTMPGPRQMRDVACPSVKLFAPATGLLALLWSRELMARFPGLALRWWISARLFSFRGLLPADVLRGRRLAWGFGLLDGLDKSASHALVHEHVGKRADRWHDADQLHQLAALCASWWAGLLGHASTITDISRNAQQLRSRGNGTPNVDVLVLPVIFPSPQPGPRGVSGNVSGR